MDQPQEIKAVLFDLGNTLIFFDADDRLDQVLQQADQALFTRLRELGYLIDSDFLQDFRRRMNLYYEEREVEFIEYTTRYVLRNLLEEKGMLVNEASLMDGLHAYHHVTQSHWQLDEATPATLQKLTQAGYRLGLISNASDDADVHNLVDQSYLRPFFQVILTSAAQGIRKPNPLIFWKALEALDVQPEQAVMVGDTLGADILGAKNAGVLSIWITQQADTPQNRAHRNTIIPDFTIENIRQLPGLLERFASPSG
jgi:HAD superfamily hydrolase (TIGR01662 family)